jgi:hypothetical protein
LKRRSYLYATIFSAKKCHAAPFFFSEQQIPGVKYLKYAKVTSGCYKLKGQLPILAAMRSGFTWEQGGMALYAVALPPHQAGVSEDCIIPS